MADTARFFYCYDKCWETSLVISNMLTTSLPPKTFLSASSALMLRLLAGSCRLFCLIYSKSFLVTSERGMGPAPTTAARSALTVIGFINAALGFGIYG